jgi:hypothetical protein
MSIFKEIEQKPLEYIVLAAALFTGFLMYVFTSHHHFALYFLGIAYFLWSLYHHYRRGDLHLSIIIEYLVFIFLGLLVLSATL